MRVCDLCMFVICMCVSELFLRVCKLSVFGVCVCMYFINFSILLFSVYLPHLFIPLFTNYLLTYIPIITYAFFTIRFLIIMIILLKSPNMHGNSLLSFYTPLPLSVV